MSMIITSSWDDGHVDDLRLAELMLKHGIRGTFYVPRRNSEGRPTLSPSELRELGQHFEIGSHTRDHVRLPDLPRAAAMEQIKSGKDYLEDVLGKKVLGFCYPGGEYNAEIKDFVIEAGFEYARTTKNLVCAASSDRFELPTTIQFYPRFGLKYLKSYFRHRDLAARWPCFKAAVLSADLDSLMKRLTEASSSNASSRNGAYFHIWGHSWEISERRIWADLENAFRYIVETVGNAQIVDNWGAWNEMEKQLPSGARCNNCRGGA